MSISIILILIALIILIILFAIAFTIHSKVFGHRFNPNPLLKYFESDDFSLHAEPVEIPNENDNNLCGYIYSKEKSDKGVVVFCHGFGPGHIAYTTEINYFCNQGYTVIAIDNLGCNLSHGKDMQGLYQGVKTAILATNYIKNNQKYKGYKIHLIGHSMGGYSAICASHDVECDSVVAISSPLTPSTVMYCAVAGIIGKSFASILRPFWFFINFLIFGKNGDLNSAKLALKSKAKKILIIQGDLDPVVPLEYSAFGNVEENQKIKKYLAKNKYHNPYASLNAQKLLNELGARLMSSNKYSDEENRSYFNKFDFAAATEEDENVMKLISEFICE